MKTLVLPGLWNDTTGVMKRFCDAVDGIWVPDESPWPADIESADLVVAHSRGCGKAADAFSAIKAAKGDTLADGTFRFKWVLFYDPVKGSGMTPEGVIDFDEIECFANIAVFKRDKFLPIDAPFSTIVRRAGFDDDSLNTVLPHCTHAGMPGDPRMVAFRNYVITCIQTEAAMRDLAAKWNANPEQPV